MPWSLRPLFTAFLLSLLSEMASSGSVLFMLSFVLLLSFQDTVHSASFNFSKFQQNMNLIQFQGDAFPSDDVLQLTKNRLDAPITSSVGRASYAEPVRVWDKKTGKLTDFTTHFTFRMQAVDTAQFGDGISFFLSPFQSEIPNNSTGGFLGLFSAESAFNNNATNSIVAVEFDSYNNTWDPNSDHVGIDVNSIVSVANVSWKTSMKDGKIGNVWIEYNSTTKNLSVFLTYAKDPIFMGNSSVWHIIDLREVLPEWVRVGFSASTGLRVELHKIVSWSFNSSLESDIKDGNNKKVALGVSLSISLGSLICVSGLLWFTIWRKKHYRKKEEEEGKGFEASMDDEFEKGTGPKRFTYQELSQATNDFSEAGKLGEGGFGGVYKGSLTNENIQVAVKRVSKGSKQGKKEYISEVKIISRLRHRNLVQLIGWCHEQGEFLLVYEFMPNGSLDSHLFGNKIPLTWAVRYRIALGLASSVMYLHEEWEQCVVHRDIKSSNIMLDSNFNAKLGDFGLARLVDHELGSQTTVLAGTMGYLAPECVTTGKASKESDIYSFGVVALEITCGRRPVEVRPDESGKVRMVEWVWDLYGKGMLLEAADKKLNLEYDERQIESLMIVGLWCCHPDQGMRPSVGQVIKVLNFEAALPSLPSKLPVPMYYAPPMEMCRFSHTSSGPTASTKGSSSYSSVSGESRKSLLLAQ